MFSEEKISTFFGVAHFLFCFCFQDSFSLVIFFSTCFELFFFELRSNVNSLFTSRGRGDF